MNSRMWAMVVGCGLWASGVLAQVSVEIPRDEGLKVLSPPTIDGASNCSSMNWRLALRGGLPGAEYVIFETLTPPGFSQPIAVAPVKPNADGVTIVDVQLINGWPEIRAQQTLNGVSSNLSAPLLRRDPAKLDKPFMPAQPLWACGRATLLSGHQPGDQVELLTKTSVSPATFSTRFVIPSAFGASNEYVPAGTEFQAGEIISARFSTCEGPPQTSPLADEVTVAKFPGTMMSPIVMSASLRPGVPRFTVSSTVNGATMSVELTRNNVHKQWEEVCAGNECNVYLPSSLGQLEEGDKVTLSQTLCPGTGSGSANEVVKACDDAAPVALTNKPVSGDQFVRLSEFPLGSTIRVFATKNANPQADLELIGVAFDTNTIALTRPISQDDLWILVAVDNSRCAAQFADGFFIGR